MKLSKLHFFIILLLLFSFGFYFTRMYIGISFLKLSGDNADWGGFGGYIGAILNVGVLSILLAQINEEKKKNKELRNERYIEKLKNELIEIKTKKEKVKIRIVLDTKLIWDLPEVKIKQAKGFQINNEDNRLILEEQGEIYNANNQTYARLDKDSKLIFPDGVLKEDVQLLKEDVQLLKDSYLKIICVDQEFEGNFLDILQQISEKILELNRIWFFSDIDTLNAIENQIRAHFSKNAYNYERILRNLVSLYNDTSGLDRRWLKDFLNIEKEIVDKIRGSKTFLKIFKNLQVIEGNNKVDVDLEILKYDEFLWAKNAPIEERKIKRNIRLVKDNKGNWSPLKYISSSILESEHLAEILRNNPILIENFRSENMTELINFDFSDEREWKWEGGGTGKIMQRYIRRQHQIRYIHLLNDKEEEFIILEKSEWELLHKI